MNSVQLPHGQCLRVCHDQCLRERHDQCLRERHEQCLWVFLEVELAIPEISTYRHLLHETTVFRIFTTHVVAISLSHGNS